MEKRPCGVNKRSEDCKVFNRIGRCFEDEHHLFYPKNQYQTKTEREFRELEDNKLYGCRDEHNDDHATQQPPTKPELWFMRRAIRVAKENRA